MTADNLPRAVRGSFRDPCSRVYESDDGILRGLTVKGLVDFDCVVATDWFQHAMADGRIVGTERYRGRAAPGDGWAATLRHDRIPVVSYPYEWSFSMLRDAALLQLELVRDGLHAGITCKDGSPYNVQFVGVRPVFIDVGSFHLTVGHPWPGYRQFCEMFLYPLLVEAHLGVPFGPWLRGSLEGITPEVADALLGGRNRLRRGVLTHVTLQARAARRYAARTEPARAVMGQPAASGRIVRAVVDRLIALVEGLEAPSRATGWTGYESRSHYSAAALEAKDRFVVGVMARLGPPVVVDLGCNDGRYARMAAQHAGGVVAIDADRRVIDDLYRSLSSASVPILPLVGDLADPSPGLGWNLQERTPLADRVAPDLVLSLALIHHLVIRRNIPVGDYLDHLAVVAPRAILEVPHRDDPMVDRLLAAKPAGSHDDYHLRNIEALVRERFEVVERHRLDGGSRTIYHLVARG